MKLHLGKRHKTVNIKHSLFYTFSIFLACFITLVITKPDFIFVQVSPVGEKIISYNKVLLISVIVSIPSAIYFIFA
jgi:hypothetical protein